MNHLIGRSGDLALYANNTHGVVLNTALGLVVSSGDALTAYASEKWEISDTSLTRSESVLADKVLSGLEEEAIIASADRMYTIPKSVQAEAEKALEWRKEYNRGGTPVGLNSARTLAKGGQIGIRKIRHIAKYFPRHEVDKKGKGWKPGQDNFPSNGRIAWALWGGDAAWRWARAIVEREDKKPVTAGGYNHSDHSGHAGYADNAENLNPFKYANELDPNYGPEFIARIGLDGSGIDRLYMVDIDGSVYVWDDGEWDSLGHADGDIWTYDRSLDDVYDLEEKSHVIIDPKSALIIAARLAVDPYCKTSVYDIDSDEAMLMQSGIESEDWDLVDQVILAAGNSTNPTIGTDGDGVYTPQERAENADKQARNALGRFAKVGERIAIGGDSEKGAGTIVSIDAKNGLTDVKLDDGRTVTVGIKYTQPLASVKTRGNAVRVDNNENAPIDFSGIIGEPRTPQNSKVAHLPGTLPKLDVDAFMRDYSSWVTKERYKPLDAADKAAVKKRWPNTKFTDAAIIAAGEKEPILTPSTSDVTPRYLAIVTQEDPSAVVDLVAIVPKTATSTSPIAYTRDGDKWVQDDQTLSDLKSSTKPPVVELDKESLDDVMLQMSESNPEKISPAEPVMASVVSIMDAFVAAGGADRNRGNAEELRRYWTTGKGAAKIRWGTPGDWTRCVRNLSKYMGVRAKGYCQLRHKEATGIYTGDRNNPGNDFSNKVIEMAALSARANEARERFGLTASSYSTGAKFSIPLVIPESLESGDGRKFNANSIEIRELPLPLMWQIKTGEGHLGSVVVGRIDHMERTENGIGNAYGVFDTGAYGREAERLVRNGFIRGVSADLDQFEAKEEGKPEAKDNAEGPDEIGKSKLTINHARVMAATIVAKPAFQECTISLVEETPANQEDEVIPEDGIYEESVDSFVEAEALTASGFLESEIPVTPPNDWFKDPCLTKATPLTIDPNGRIYGHIAAWHVNHIGMPRSTRPPRSKSKYAYFHTGVVRTDAGKDVPVGQLTLAGGHASLQADAQSAAKHYDDTASAIADVHAGEDDYGIYVAGCLRPDATEMQIRALRASAPSGDWRPVNGSLELVAVCQVNVPGFPIARALVASGKVFALVAAGAYYMATLQSEAVTTLVDRAQNLSELSAKTPDLKARVKKAKKAARSYAVTAAAAKAEDLRNRALVASAVAELAKFSDEERTKLADKGFALPDGSYPIRNEDDLRNAIRAYGRAKPQDRVKVRKHIGKRARALNKTYLIPVEWNSAASAEVASIVASMRSRITEFAEAKEISEEELKKLADAKAEADKQTQDEIKIAEDIAAGKTTAKEVYDEEGRSKYTPKTQPRDAKGKYRKVLARLKQNLGVAGLQKALLKVQDAENLEFAGNYADSAKASEDLLGMIDRLDTKALNPESLENVKSTAAELGKVIANLPLPFGKDAEKLKFSDLPAGLKTLIDQMITRVEAKIGKEDANVATQELKSYMSGADYYSQGEIQSQMNKLLRLLT